ncbi:sigma-w pathway protein ysdB [Shouchella lonarensis]|uniref:Sigma-w pathway protein ysdB n=1 Tax=Shouchella lonarensis TaxID=1464122 RepID=A0A1G6K4Q5_9BACI|nr:sigma-w pathway protein ysdB [Shouchella lonarensis]SDC25903.1 hypothetical protein SAMN05421737_106194 [Shouchella lonarensis]
MLVYIFRLLLIAIAVIFVYSIVTYFMHPNRKLQKAHETKQFYFLDDEKNVRKNFQLTYKGVLFEGEKYLSATQGSFSVEHIYMKAEKHDLQGFDHDDFHFIEQEIGLRYPKAQMIWPSPIKEFLRKH